MRIIYHNETRYIVRFDKGEELVSELMALAVREGIKGAWLSGFGGAQEAVIAHYEVESRVYRDITIQGDLEAASLSGTIALFKRVPVLHLHGVLGKEDKSACAGHIKRLVVGGTCEISLEVIPVGLVRRQDEATGLLVLE